jgi:hypothetical protein
MMDEGVDGIEVGGDQGKDRAQRTIGEGRKEEGR